MSNLLVQNIKHTNATQSIAVDASGNVTVGNLVTSGSGGTLSNINVVSANTFTFISEILTTMNVNITKAVYTNIFFIIYYSLRNFSLRVFSGCQSFFEVARFFYPQHLSIF